MRGLAGKTLSTTLRRYYVGEKTVWRVPALSSFFDRPCVWEVPASASLATRRVRRAGGQGRAEAAAPVTARDGRRGCRSAGGRVRMGRIV